MHYPPEPTVSINLVAFGAYSMPAITSKGIKSHSRQSVLNIITGLKDTWAK